MKLLTKFLTVEDLIRITKFPLGHKTVMVKFRDRSFQEIRIILVTGEEVRHIIDYSISTGSFVDVMSDNEDARWKEIPGAVGMVNGFLIMEDRCELYINNGVIDLIRIHIDAQRIKMLMTEATQQVAKNT